MTFVQKGRTVPRAEGTCPGHKYSLSAKSPLFGPKNVELEHLKLCPGQWENLGQPTKIKYEP